MEPTERVKETFLPGKRFRVISNLTSLERYNGITAVSSMLKYAGQYVTIAEITRGNKNTCAIKIEEDGRWWNWSDEMFVDPYGEEALPDVDIHIDHLMEVISVL